MHIKYRDFDGKILPSVTQVIGIISTEQNQLMNWANSIGLKGIKLSEANKITLDIGSTVHKMIESYLKEESFVMPDELPAESRQTAQICFQQFKEWYKGYNIEMSENSMISKTHGFGGTIDAMFRINNEMVLVDFKTSNDIYPSYWMQVAAYSSLAHENGYDVDKAAVLRLPKDGGNYEFIAKNIDELKPYWKVFKTTLQLYNHLQEIKKEKK